MRTLTADTIIHVRTSRKTPAKKPLTGDSRIRLDRIIGLKECHEQLIQDKHSNYKIGETAQWKDGLHQKTAHGWIKVPGQKDGYNGVKALAKILKTRVLLIFIQSLLKVL